MTYDEWSKGENKPEEKEDEDVEYCRENEKVGVEESTEMEMKRRVSKREGGLNKEEE